MKKQGNLVLTILFLSFIIGLGLAIQVFPDRASSFHENRALAQKPPLKVESLLNGTYPAQFDNYFIDQFFARDIWMEGYLKWQQLSQETFLFNYYVNEDGWIYPKPLEYFAQESIDESIAYLTEFTEDMSQRGLELYFFSLPGRANALKAPFPDYVQEGYDTFSKDYFLEKLSTEGITVVNMGDQFKDKFDNQELQNLYFQTDPHWNINGVFEGYEMIYNTFLQTSNYFNEPNFKKNDYTKHCYKDETFLGSYNK